MSRRWRKPDSNRRYRVTRSRFEERLMSPPLDSPAYGKLGTNFEPKPRERRVPSAGPMVRIRFPPAGSHTRTHGQPVGLSRWNYPDCDPRDLFGTPLGASYAKSPCRSSSSLRVLRRQGAAQSLQKAREFEPLFSRQPGPGARAVGRVV
jgi:hypothetical protein